MAKFICPECGTEFDSPPSWGKSFCSRICSGASLSRRYKGKKPSPQCLEASARAASKRLINPEMQAKMQAALQEKRQDAQWLKDYGKRISAGLKRYYETHDGPNKGRSMPQTKEHTKKITNTRRRARITIACEWCNKFFDRLPSQMQNHNFCSRKCAVDWIGFMHSGENHPFWKGGHQTWRGTNWKEQAEKARERDGYICQDCGRTQDESTDKWNRILDVHHIIPFSEFESWKDANQLTNLATLCVRCHSKIESDILLNGYSGCTKQL